ncbi:MAG: signal peptidase II [Roseiflexaceae bacterium]|nr:signal peptidase II [Roseiflexaceae bacterium]
MRNIWIVPGIVMPIVVIADQLTKFRIYDLLGGVEGNSIPLLGDWLKFTFVKNTGVAFGMFQNFPYVFTITSILISIGALYFYRTQLPNQNPLVQLTVGAIVGGAIGNIIDRLRIGYVIDFIHVTWFPGIFNIADACISVGVVVLALVLMLHGEQPKQATPTTGEALANGGEQNS